MKILVTGTAGFIGFHLLQKLPSFNLFAGIGNINIYYNIPLKFDCNIIDI